MVSALKAADLGLKAVFPVGLCFSRLSHTSDLKIGTPMVTPPSSVLGLVGLVSVYCNRVRQQDSFATSTSVWQNNQLSEQIRP